MPASDHEADVAAVVRSQQLKALEAGRPGHPPGSGRKAPLELFEAFTRDRDRIDLDDAHDQRSYASPAARGLNPSPAERRPVPARPPPEQVSRRSVRPGAGPAADRDPHRLAGLKPELAGDPRQQRWTGDSLHVQSRYRVM